MNSQSLFSQALLLSGEGGDALSRGDGDFACKKYKAALELLRHVPYLVEIKMEGQGVGVANALSSLAISQLYDDTFFICNKPIVTILLDGPGEINTKAVMTLSLGIVFNMALLYHQKALAKNSKKMYRLAFLMYDQCLSLCQSSGSGPFTTSNVLMTMALNNIAHLYFSTGALQEAASMLEKMQRVIHATDFSNCGLKNFDFLDEVLLNAMVIDSPKAAPCA